MIKYSGQWNYLDPKEKVYAHVKPDSEVLDLGCSVGLLGLKLKKEKQCRVDGVEIMPESAAEAKKRLDRVGVFSLEDLESLKSFLGQKKYDYIICGDVLEHTSYPGRILEVLRNHLNRDGEIVVSLPNVVRYDVRLKFLKGQFDYTPTGILDETHLRFFTRKTAQELLEKAGYRVLKIEYTLPDRPKLHPLAPLARGLFSTQFIIYASPN